MILINALMGVGKAKIDSLCMHAVVKTKSLPPRHVSDKNHWDDIVLVPLGPGRADIAAGGYADDRR